jgi:ATP-dependent DNA helicase RecQ
VAQRGHESISTFGVGAEYSEQQLRAVMRQLIAIGALHVHTEEGFSTLHLTDGSRAVLKGDVPVQLRESTSQRADKRTRSRSAPSPAAANLGQDAMVRYINLKAWRAEVAKEHNLPTPKPGAAARHQRAGRQEARSLRPAGPAGVQRVGLITCAQLGNPASN